MIYPKDAFAAILIALLFLLVQSIPEETMDEIVSKCLATSHETEIFEIFAADSSRNYKCFMHCFAKEANILDSKGYINLEEINKITDSNSIIFDTVDDCKQLYDGTEDLCQYTFDMMICFYKSFTGKRHWAIE